MKILSGFEQPTSGTLLVDGRATHFNGSRQAEAAGIVLIHQEINLAEDLTIAQNIFLGREIRHAGFLDNRAMSREAAHRPEEHTSELQSLMRISYAVFCLKNKTHHPHS